MIAGKDMAEQERAMVVARYRNGRIVKGFTQNFYVNKDEFHVFPPDDPSAKSTGILVRDLKAVFFVRDLSGDPLYSEIKKFEGGERSRGHRVEVTFWDGEVLVGSTLGYGGSRSGFFFTPADPKSNNVKVFAITSAVQKVRRS